MLTDIRLQNFRSYKDQTFEFAPGVNVIVGPNASGKTNLLEAVMVLRRGSSFRAADNELIKRGKDWARLDSHNSDNELRTLKFAFKPTKTKLLEINGKPHKRLTQDNSLPTILFEPNHSLLFIGEPDKRRDYLDDLIEQISAGYGIVRAQYRRTLSQRNRLLKQNKANLPDEIFPWNVRLAQLAGQIVQARQDLAAAINQKINSYYFDVSKSKINLETRYLSTSDYKNYETKMLRRIDENLDRDRILGFTTVGPHREDLSIYINGQPCQNVASRGELRSLALALKLYEIDLISSKFTSPPLLLLDDVFSELDTKRRRALLKRLSNQQTIITTTDADIVAQAGSNFNFIALK